MFGLLDMIILHVRKNPNIPGILSEWITRELSNFWSLKVLLVWILRRDPYWIEVKRVVLRFCEPQNRFVSTRQSLRTMEAMLDMPNDAIAQMQSVVFENPIQNNVEREDLPILHVIADLPADRALIVQ